MDSQKMLDAVFMEATIGIIVINSDGEIVQANPFSENLFGYEKGELISREVEQLLPESFRKRHVKHRQGYNEKPIPRTMGANLDLYGLRKDGSKFPIEISLSHMDINGKRFAIAYTSDASERKNLLKRILKQSDELEIKVIERTKKLKESEEKLRVSLEKEKELGELKSRFVSMASHEFRTPLSSILSSSNLISRYEKEEQQDKRMKHVNRIESSVRNLTMILNDFLSLEKLESGKVRFNPVELEVKDFIQQIIDEVNLTVKGEQKVVHIHSGGKHINTDEHLMKNILINLLSNGIKYSPNEKNVELHTQVDDEKFQIQVKDYGIGIPKEEQQHMFTRFFRANNVETIQGTGLGLTIVKRYLDLMNGKIWFESKEGEGTTFFVEVANM